MNLNSVKSEIQSKYGKTNGIFRLWGNTKQGGELYQDPMELETLRKFKTDTEAEKVKQTKDKAFEGLLVKLNVRPDLKPLVTKMLDYYHGLPRYNRFTAYHSQRSFRQPSILECSFLFYSKVYPKI